MKSKSLLEASIFGTNVKSLWFSTTRHTFLLLVSSQQRKAITRVRLKTEDVQMLWLKSFDHKHEERFIYWESTYRLWEESQTRLEFLLSSKRAQRFKVEQRTRTWGHSNHSWWLRRWASTKASFLFTQNLKLKAFSVGIFLRKFIEGHQRLNSFGEEAAARHCQPTWRHSTSPITYWELCWVSTSSSIATWYLSIRQPVFPW